MWEKILKFLIGILIFFYPFFVLPLTFEAFELSKSILLLFFTLLALIIYFFKILTSKTFTISISPNFIFLFIFLFAISLSFLFSVERLVSLFGFYGKYSLSFLLSLFFVIFVFLVVQNFKEPKKLVNLFILGCLFSAIIFYFSYFQLWQKLHLKVPVYFNQQGFNLTSSDLRELAVFWSVILVFLCGSFINSEKKSQKIIFGILTFLFLILLLILRWKISIFIFVAGISFLILFGLISREYRQEIHVFYLPIFLLFLGIFSIFFLPPSNLIGIEIFPSNKIFWKVSLSTIKSSLKNFFLGTGPSTFFEDYLKYRPKEINSTPFWAFKFSYSKNYISQILAEIGILGLISYFLLVFSIFYFAFSLKEKKKILPYFSSFFALILAQFFYNQNAILNFSFWFLLCLNFINLHQETARKIEFSLPQLPEMRLIFFIFFLIFLFFAVFIYYFGVKFYLAEIYHFKSQNLTDLARIDLLKKAISFNPKFPFYYIFLSREALNYGLLQFQNNQLDKAQIFIALAIDSAKEATALAPNYSLAFENLGSIYRDIQNLATGADKFAIDSFSKALSLDPQNPVLYTEIGKVYLNQGNLEKAKEYFKLAKERKEDYADLQLQEAKVLGIEGKTKEAIEKLESLKQIYPFWFDLKYELGILYYNLNDLDKAIANFEEIVSQFPNHSNSLYFLGLCYEQKGEKQKAIQAFEKVLQLNPGVEEIKRKIENLKK